MTPAEITVLLTAAKLYDDRVTPDAGRVQAWVSALDEDIPADFARDALVAHYASSTYAFMPAHLNQAWRIERRSRDEQAANERRAQEARELEASACPPPPEVREMIRRLTGRTA